MHRKTVSQSNVVSHRGIKPIGESFGFDGPDVIRQDHHQIKYNAKRVEIKVLNMQAALWSLLHDKLCVDACSSGEKCHKDSQNQSAHRLKQLIPSLLV